jgi:hypothetical protein
MTEAVTAMCVKVALTAQAKEKVMNKEYWQLRLTYAARSALSS